MNEELLEIQRCYPQVFHACHTRHARARTNTQRLSDRDSYLLGHLDLSRPASAGELARHVGVGASALSATVKRLERLGYLERRRRVEDHRRQELYLTHAGRSALQKTSVLDTKRLESVMKKLSERERAAAVRGLRLLARAARDLMSEGRSE